MTKVYGDPNCTESQCEFVHNLFWSLPIVPTRFSLDDARDDLENFSRDGWNFPLITAEKYCELINDEIKEVQQ